MSVIERTILSMMSSWVLKRIQVASTPTARPAAAPALDPTADASAAAMPIPCMFVPP